MSQFHIGQRVRMNEKGRTTFPRDRSHAGRIAAVYVELGETYLRIDRDRYARRRQRFHASFWEPVPADELAADEVAVSLAHAVLGGETHAAMVLADRVFELCGGTK